MNISDKSHFADMDHSHCVTSHYVQLTPQEYVIMIMNQCSPEQSPGDQRLHSSACHTYIHTQRGAILCEACILCIMLSAMLLQNNVKPNLSPAFPI